MARPRGKALERRRQVRAEERAATAVAASRKRSLLWVAAGIIGVAAVALYVLTRPPPPGVEFESLGNMHIAPGEQSPVPYNSQPPSSGPHHGAVPAGIQEEPVPPEAFVHTLEDGGIVLAYDCPDDCPELVSGLTEVLEGRPGDLLLLTPYEGITHPDGQAYRGAAVAWTRVFYFDELDAETRGQLEQFIRLFEGIDHHVRGGSPLGP